MFHNKFRDDLSTIFPSAQVSRNFAIVPLNIFTSCEGAHFGCAVIVLLLRLHTLYISIYKSPAPQKAGISSILNRTLMFFILPSQEVAVRASKFPVSFSSAFYLKFEECGMFLTLFIRYDYPAMCWQGERENAFWISLATEEPLSPS